jgi:N-formylglutamate deformylase
LDGREELVSVPVILHIPHSSTDIPGDIRSSICLSDEALKDELLKMTDHFTDELFTGHDVPVSPVIFPVSRLVLDPERFIEDDLETMSRKGMGVVYKKTSAGNPLRENGFLPDQATLIHSYYEPHHDALNRLATQAIQETGSCMVIDCHSFPSEPHPYEDNREKARPDICLGTDSFHTPEWLMEDVLRVFHSRGLTTAFNTPFSGTIVPSRFYQRESRAYAVMIEVNRALYMEESSGKKNEDFANLRRLLGEAVRAVETAWKSHEP